MKYFDKIIKENPEISTKKINITNKLKELYKARKEYFENIYINKEKNKNIKLRLLDDEIR